MSQGSLGKVVLPVSNWRGIGRSRLRPTEKETEHCNRACVDYLAQDTTIVHYRCMKRFLGSFVSDLTCSFEVMQTSPTGSGRNHA